MLYGRDQEIYHNIKVVNMRFITSYKSIDHDIYQAT